MNRILFSLLSYIGLPSQSGTACPQCGSQVSTSLYLIFLIGPGEGAVDGVYPDGGGLAVHVEPPVAGGELLVEQGPVGAEEGEEGLR